MDVNITVLAVVLLVIIVLLIFLIRRNQKDKKDFEQEVIDAESKPDKHDEERA